jgi:hypothetical protein
MAFMAVVGTVLSVASSIYAGVSAAKQGEYNAKVAEQQAQAIKQAQVANEPIYEDEFQSLLGEQRAASASQGVVATTGSSLAVQRDAYMRYLRDKRSREFNADVGISQAQSAGELSRMQGKAALTGSLLGAAGQVGTSVGTYSLLKGGEK